MYEAKKEHQTKEVEDIAQQKHFSREDVEKSNITGYYLVLYITLKCVFYCFFAVEILIRTQLSTFPDCKSGPLVTFPICNQSLARRLLRWLQQLQLFFALVSRNTNGSPEHFMVLLCHLMFLSVWVFCSYFVCRTSQSCCNLQ